MKMMDRYIVLDTNCFIVANADYIVTEDSHFNVLKGIPFPHVEIKRLHEFCQEL